MSSLITAFTGGNLIANRQASNTAGQLNQNAESTLSQILGDNSNLANQQSNFASLYSNAMAGASSILGSPVLNAGKLGKGLATNKTGPLGDQSAAATATYKLLGN